MFPICSSCGNQRETQMKNSKLMPGTRLFLCDDCIGMEPRYLIVIFARQNGLAAVAKYISKRLYRGDEIMASELV